MKMTTSLTRRNTREGYSFKLVPVHISQNIFSNPQAEDVISSKYYRIWETVQGENVSVGIICKKQGKMNTSERADI